MKIIHKILKVILNVLVILSIIVVLIVGYSLIQTKIQNKDYANIFGYTLFEVSTGSMSGAIEIGDVILVKICNDNIISPNDIIAFKQEEYIVTHRVIKIEQDKIITKGDANNSQDEPISKDAVIGKVEHIIHNVGIWKKVMKTPEVFISIITTIILFGLAFSYNDKPTQQEAKTRRKRR